MMTLFTATRSSAAGTGPKRSAASSTVAIATATLFVLVTTALGLALDRHSAQGEIGGGWRLRGALESSVIASRRVEQA